MAFEDAVSLRRPAGHILLDGREVADTAQCVHCGGHFVMRRGSGTVRGWCPRCNGIVCGPSCAACVPAEQRLEIREAQARR